MFLSLQNSCSEISESKSKIFPYTSLKINVNKRCWTGQPVSLEPIPLSGEGVWNGSGSSLVLYIESNTRKLLSNNSVPSLSTHPKTQGKMQAVMQPHPQTLHKHKPYHQRDYQTLCVTALTTSPDGFVCLHIANFSVDNSLSKYTTVCFSCRRCRCST